MSAIRRLSAVYRSEQRHIRACPYHRSEESEQKEKKSSRVRQPSFFSSYLPLIPAQWGSYLEYFNIFNIFGSSKDSKKKVEEDANVVVVPEEDVVMTDSDATSTTTDDLSSDSSVEVIEVSETVEPVAPVELIKPSEPATALPHAVPTSNLSLNDASPSLPSPQSSYQIASAGTPASSSSTAFLGSTCDEVVQWAWQKFQSQTPMNDAELEGLKVFLKQSRGEQPFSPIKLRYSRYNPPLKPSNASNSGFVSASSQRPDIKSASIPSSTDADSPVTASGSSYWSAFHSSTGLPTFKNNAQPSRPRMLKRGPIVPITGTLFEESRKRPALSTLPRLDPYKRRRLFEKTNNPDSSRSQVSSSNTAEAGPSPTSAPHPNINRQYTAPHAPSPLRNVVNGISLSLPRQTNTMPTNLNASGSKGTRSTYSATLVQEIVQKAPPRPRYSDVVNPYQTAAPVKPLTRPMEKKKMSERRARTRELEKQREAARVKEMEKRKELSAKEIIEATIPKGAKRSRAPPSLMKSKPISTSVPVVTSKRSLEEAGEEGSITKKRRTVTVEEVFEDDDAGNHSLPVRPNVIIEPRSPSPEPAPGPVRPCVEPSAKELPSKGALGRGVANKEQATNAVRVKDSTSKMTSVKEVPSKAPSTKEPTLRVPAVKDSSAKTPGSKVPSTKSLSNHFTPLLNAKAMGKSSVPREPSKLRTSFLPDDYENEEPKVASPTPAATVVMTTPGTPLADIQEKKDPKEVALTLPLNDLPSFIFKTPPTLTAYDQTDARVAAKELPVNSLPKFDFSKARSSTNGIYLPAVPIPTIKPFDFGAAGINPSPSPSKGQWQCQICMLQNPSSAVEKCTVCDSPRPDIEKPKKAIVNSINDASGAHGLNGASDKDTPSNSLSDSLAVKGFDFSAAGLKPDYSISDGQWICPTCMVQNPPTAVEKCKICDSSREEKKTEKPKKPYVNGTTHSVAHLTDGISTPTTKSFDFAAAGVKLPAPPSNGNWQCPTCMLQNPLTAAEKCEICDSPRPRPGVEKRPAALSRVPAKPSTPAVSKSFDWAAAGMLPKMNGNSWTCGTCMLSNPPTATEKCRVCDASRS